MRASLTCGSFVSAADSARDWNISDHSSRSLSAACFAWNQLSRYSRRSSSRHPRLADGTSVSEVMIVSASLWYQLSMAASCSVDFFGCLDSSMLILSLVLDQLTEHEPVPGDQGTSARRVDHRPGRGDIKQCGLRCPQFTADHVLELQAAV